ncbi:hypothetical protein ABID56_001529 [Alkalibacillus flavidus]|uniref:TipAS antibiotic-recognition domain-containing protein n=1 Tax=Alkalibacillus flavidus TaxID=546021 RepID=A0ABV2KV33_9BACI
MKLKVTIGVAVTMVVMLVIISVNQYMSVNQYQRWISDDLNNDLGAVSQGILSNEEVLSDVVVAHEITTEDAQLLERNAQYIYRLKTLQDFTVEMFNYKPSDFDHSPEPSSTELVSRLADEAQFISEEREGHLNEDDVTMIEKYLALHKQWAKHVNDYYPSISSEGAGQTFFSDHENMVAEQEWVSFILDVKEETEGYNP